MYVCPRTGDPLKDWHSVKAGVTYPLVDGVPVLVTDPKHFLARRTVGDVTQADATRCGLPDAITPHLPPSLFGAPAGFGQWLTSLGETSPAATAGAMGVKHAPPGPALDVGCGVGVMTRRMAATGRDTWAFDHSLDAVLLARGLVTGTLSQTVIPTSRRGSRRVKVPLVPVGQKLHFCVADPMRPPFAARSFAWVHLGNLLDTAGDAVGDVLVATENVLAKGGLLTLTTAYDGPAAPAEGAAAPEEELLEALEALGLQVVDQQDRVPAVVREYDRGYSVRFVHCVAAVKR